MSRRQNFQTVSWFNDLRSRALLDLDPPYQRRSVWNQSFKDYFIDTVLLDYPAPAIFLYEDISPEGRSVYHVVDGKQRLTTIFEFVADEFPISEGSDLTTHRGKYFSSLDDTLKRQFWGYQFLVEYVPTNDEKVISGIFNRINRNVAKLTAQELRHARFDGEFISTAESLSEWMLSTLPEQFPRIASQSRKQMKDVEFVALLLLQIETGPRGYSQEELDQAFSERDASWDNKLSSESTLRAIIEYLRAVVESLQDPRELLTSRFRNQADFYSLVGALTNLRTVDQLPGHSDAAQRLLTMVRRVEDENERRDDPSLADYYEAARSASNDRGPRERRIAYVTKVLLGEQ